MYDDDVYVCVTVMMSVILFVLDPSKRMQKLLGRIRQQQDAWSKQNVNRKVDNFSEKDQMGRGKICSAFCSSYAYLLFMYCAIPLEILCLHCI